MPKFDFEVEQEITARGVLTIDAASEEAAMRLLEAMNAAEIDGAADWREMDTDIDSTVVVGLMRKGKSKP